MSATTNLKYMGFQLFSERVITNRSSVALQVVAVFVG